MSKRRAQPAPLPPHSARLKLSWREALVGEAVLFLIYLLALKWWVMPELQYQEAESTWYSPPAWRSMMTHPGGALEHLLDHWFMASQSPWLIAVLNTFLTCGACQATRLLLGRATGAYPKAAHLVFVPLLFALQSQYDLATVRLALHLALALGFGVGIASLPRRSPGLRLASSLALVAALYGLAGFPPVAPCVLAAILAEAGKPAASRPHQSIGLILGAAALFLVHSLALGAKVSDTFAAWNTAFLSGMAAAFCGVLIGATAALRFSGAHENHSPEPAAHKTPTPPPSTAVGASWLAPLWLVTFLAGTAIAGLTFPAAKRAHLQLCHLAEQRQWAEYLANARTRHNLTLSEQADLMRALYYTGQLPETLFTYPLVKSDDLLPSLENGPRACQALGSAMLELGQVNQAEHFACEALELAGPRPEVLRTLAQVQILKNHPLAAGNFLRVLQRNPFQAAWATARLEQLSADASLRNDPETARQRAVMVTTDYTDSSNPTAPLMQQLLHSNPTNQMAFEYLMAHYLVTGQFEKFMEHIGRIKSFAYPALPRHYEEAILLAHHLKKIPIPVLPGYAIRRETAERQAKFNDIVRTHLPNILTARPQLAREFGDTYWFFFLFGTSAAYQETTLAKP